jgi:hypothetical protein
LNKSIGKKKRHCFSGPKLAGPSQKQGSSPLSPTDSSPADSSHHL